MSKLLQNTLVRLVLMSVCAAALLFGLATAFVPAQHPLAHAATHTMQHPMGDNGQVLDIECGPYQVWDTYVYGDNQNGDYVSWHGNGNGNNFVVTYGWYWKGNVHVDLWWSYNGGSWDHQNYYVPVHYNGNVYTVYC
jgi:hypothetical protein